MFGQKLANPDWGNRDSVSKYRKAMKNLQEVKNPYGWWRYSGAAAVAPKWGRKYEYVQGHGWKFN